MDLSKSISMLKTERKLILRAIENLSDEQLLKIPEGSKNNILWNLGHIIVTEHVLHYTLSRLEMHMQKEFVSMFRTGTSRGVWKETPNISELKSLLLTLSQTNFFKTIIMVSSKNSDLIKLQQVLS